MILAAAPNWAEQVTAIATSVLALRVFGAVLGERSADEVLG